jgi:hypothetical protein
MKRKADALANLPTPSQFERLRMWPRAYETKVLADYRQAVGRGRTPEAAHDNAPVEIIELVSHGL